MASSVPFARQIGLPLHYRRRGRVAYFEDSTPGVVWQPEVYEIAAALLPILDAVHVVDIGCGSAEKLVAISDAHSIGVDYGTNLDMCRDRYPDRDWLRIDILHPHRIPLPPSIVARSIVVCSDVIEHLPNPLHLLRTLRDFSRTAAAVLISTPDRSRVYGRPNFGPPDNPCHAQEWTMPEFTSLLEDAGMVLALAGRTAENNYAEERRTLLTLSFRGGHKPGYQARAQEEALRAARALLARPLPLLQGSHDKI